MQPSLTRIAIGLSSIVGLRMFGLFLVLPVLAIYGAELRGATPALLGLALGAYGATQAIFQIPLGWLSDRLGRKPVIVLGLLVFLAGSVLAALADSIWGIILGRALQGGGAIAAAVLALAADLTPADRRPRVLAVIGISIGLSFLLALVAGPALAGAFGLSGLFWITAGLAVAAIIGLLVLVPAPPARVRQPPVPGAFRRVLLDQDLFRLNLGIATINFALMALFLVVPLVIVEAFDLSVARHWQVYLPVLLATVPVLALGIRHGERKGGSRGTAVLSGAAMTVALVLLAVGGELRLLLVLGLWLFFCGFNLLEACLPALTSRHAPERTRGSALGVYASYQFAGAFFGGALGGLVLEAGGFPAVLILAAVVMALAALALRGLSSDPPETGAGEVPASGARPPQTG